MIRILAPVIILAFSICHIFASNSQQWPRFAWFRKAVEEGIVTREKSPRERCDAGALKVENGLARHSALLNRMEGFAQASGTIGGLGQKVFFVTSLVDRRERGGHGPAGSLREALWRAKEAGGGWITISDDLLQERRIDLEFALFVPANTTIDGGCHGLALSTPGTSVLVVEGVDNIVITRLRLEQREPYNKGRGDCVSVSYADRIWIAFNLLRRCEDGLIDIGMKQFAPDKVSRATIAYNHFLDHEKDVLIATYDCAGPNVGKPGCNNQMAIPWTWNGGVQVTLQGNLFDGTSQRHPRLAGQTYAHMVGNVVAFAPVEREPGRFGSNYGSYAGAGSRLLAQNNLYIALSGTARTKAIQAEPQQSATRLSGNVVLGGASVDEFSAEAVMNPPYKINNIKSWTDFYSDVTCIASNAGPEGFKIGGNCQ